MKILMWLSIKQLIASLGLLLSISRFVEVRLPHPQRMDPYHQTTLRLLAVRVVSEIIVLVKAW